MSFTGVSVLQVSQCPYVCKVLSKPTSGIMVSPSLNVLTKDKGGKEQGSTTAIPAARDDFPT